MGLADDAAEATKIGGPDDYLNQTGAWAPRPDGTITVDLSLWQTICEAQITQAQKIGKARLEIEAAMIAHNDHASHYWLGKAIQRALEALL